MSEQISPRGITTHVSLTVEPDPDRPMMQRFEMNDDGNLPPGETMAKAILAAYPPAIVELLLNDLLAAVVLSDEFAEATKFLDRDKTPDWMDRRRRMLVRLAGHWERNRMEAYQAHRCRHA